jgi:hypothetical protein
MRRKVRPAARSATTRARISGRTEGGRPRRTPSRRRIANAARVRSPIARRSHWATAAMTFATNSPAGVVVSTPRSSAITAHPSRRAHSGKPAASMRLLLRRSSFRTTNASASPAENRLRASERPGRAKLRPLAAASSCIATTSHPRRFVSWVMPSRWAAKARAVRGLFVRREAHVSDDSHTPDLPALARAVKSPCQRIESSEP